jgi:hypothetical protein
MAVDPTALAPQVSCWFQGEIVGYTQAVYTAGYKPISMHRKIPKKFLNKLGTPQTLPKYFHLISIYPISRNNSQAYILYMLFLFNLCKFISPPSQLQITPFHHQNSSKIKPYLFMSLALLFGAHLNSSLIVFPFL